MRLIDRTGERYGRLVVLSRAPNKSERDTNARWNCRCACGRAVVAYGQDLKRGKVKSCGCLNAQRILKHGLTRTKIYRIWQGIFQRCENPKEKNYHNYGGRGITVDPAWRDFNVFLRDMGQPPAGASLERMDNNGPYSKENCCWATMKAQLNNTRSNRIVEAFGRRQTLMQWAEEYGLGWYTLRSRIQYGWPIEKALTEPIKPGLALGKRK